MSRFGLIYAGAQKNIGPAGLTIVIVRDDLVGLADPPPPPMLDYATHAKAGSMYNTPPTYAIYLAGLVFAQLLDDGGLAAAEQRNIAKAELLYDAIDDEPFYANPVEPGRPVADERAVHPGRSRARRRVPGRRRLSAG